MKSLTLTCLLLEILFCNAFDEWTKLSRSVGVPPIPIFNVSSETYWFFFNLRGMKMSAGRSFCRRVGSELVTIRSDYECARLQSAITYFSGKTDITIELAFWLGITNKDVEGTWTYKETQQPLIYTKWKDGKPSMSYNTDKSCAVVKYDDVSNPGSGGLWKDVRCKRRKMVACEPRRLSEVTSRPNDEFNSTSTLSHTSSLATARTTPVISNVTFKTVTSEFRISHDSSAATELKTQILSNLTTSTELPDTTRSSQAVFTEATAQSNMLTLIESELLRADFISDEFLETTTNYIGNITSDFSFFESEERIDEIVTLLQNIWMRVENVTQTVLENILIIVNNLHDYDLSEHTMSLQSKAILTRSLEEFARRTVLPNNETLLRVVTNSVAVQVQIIPPTVTEVTFSSSDIRNSVSSDRDSSLLLVLTSQVQTRLEIIVYEDDLFFPTNFHAERVLSVSLSDESLIESLIENPLQFSTPLLSVNTTQEYRFISCSFWDINSLEWSSEGCNLIQDTIPPRCQCNHLSNFALVVRVHYIPTDLGLDIVGKVGCSLSIAGFFFTALIYLTISELRLSKPGPIHIQLCVCLCIAYLVFVVGSNQIHEGLVCLGVAASMHYFLLAAWIWMLVEGIAMYKTLVKKSMFLGDYFLLKWSLVAYTLPAITVAITLGVTVGYIDSQKDWYPDPDNSAIVESTYVHDNFCWLHGSTLILGFLIEIGCIFALNTIIYGIVIRSITWGRKKIQSSQVAATSKDHVIKVTSVAVLLGVTWVFSIPLFQTGDQMVILIFSYIFSILNSLQGVTIFFLFCVRSPTTRALWIKPIVEFFNSMKCKRDAYAF